MKTGDQVFVVRRVSKLMAVVDQGTVICAGDDKLSWHDDSGLTSTSLAEDCFPTRLQAEAHRDAVLGRAYP